MGAGNSEDCSTVDYICKDIWWRSTDLHAARGERRTLTTGSDSVVYSCSEKCLPQANIPLKRWCPSTRQWRLTAPLWIVRPRPRGWVPRLVFWYRFSRMCQTSCIELGLLMSIHVLFYSGHVGLFCQSACLCAAMRMDHRAKGGECILQHRGHRRLDATRASHCRRSNS